MKVEEERHNKNGFWQRAGFVLAMAVSLFLHGLVLAAIYVQAGPEWRAPKSSDGCGRSGVI